MATSKKRIVTKSFDESSQPELMIELMYKTTQDHSCGWNHAKKTALFCKINLQDDPIIIQNDLCGQENKHAEELLIDELNQREDKSLQTKITIYINNLPCPNCNKKLIQFLIENPNVILILYVANVYNIRRPCSNESHYLHVSENDHQVKMELKTLMTHERCVVSAFSYAVWSELLNIVAVPKMFKDHFLNGYRTKLDPNDSGRVDKDNAIRNELYEIRHLPLYVINKVL